MAARRSRRRKGAARRKSRRAAAVVHHNAPKRAKRRGRVHARKSRSGARRSFRRNPPRAGIVGMFTDAAIDGLSVTGGVVLQNNVVRYVPDLLPATMSNAAMLNGAIKDVGGIVAGAFALHKMFGADRARFIVAGQAHAAIARVLRSANVPVLSTSLGEYDPIRGVGIYSQGLIRPVVRNVPALPAPKPNNVQTLKGIGIYTDGMSSSPSLF